MNRLGLAELYRYGASGCVSVLDQEEEDEQEEEEGGG